MLDKLLNWIAHNMLNKDFMIIETVHTGNVDLSKKKKSIKQLISNRIRWKDMNHSA